MQYNQILTVMDQFNLFGIPQKIKNLYFEKTIPLSAESCKLVLSYISLYMNYNHDNIRIFFTIEGASRQEIL